jgi:hypothetical protein
MSRHQEDSALDQQAWWSRLSQCRHTRHYCWNVHHHRAGHLGCHHEDRNCQRDGAVARETMYTVLSLLSLDAQRTSLS